MHMSVAYGFVGYASCVACVMEYSVCGVFAWYGWYELWVCSVSSGLGVCSVHVCVCGVVVLTKDLQETLCRHT